MGELPNELKAKYEKEAEDHAIFLCEKVFKPAYIMAFIHGVKHGREDLRDEIVTDYRENNKEQHET